MARLARQLCLLHQTGAMLVIAKLNRLSRDAAVLLMLRNSGARLLACDMPEANDLTEGKMGHGSSARRRPV